MSLLAGGLFVLVFATVIVSTEPVLWRSRGGVAGLGYPGSGGKTNRYALFAWESPNQTFTIPSVSFTHRAGRRYGDDDFWEFGNNTLVCCRRCADIGRCTAEPPPNPSADQIVWWMWTCFSEGVLAGVTLGVVVGGRVGRRWRNWSRRVYLFVSGRFFPEPKPGFRP